DGFEKSAISVQLRADPSLQAFHFEDLSLDRLVVIHCQERIRPVREASFVRLLANGEIAMAIFRRSPNRTHFRIIYEILCKSSRPVLISDSAGVRFAFDHCVEDFDLASAGVTVLSHVEIKTNGRDVLRRIDTILFQKIERKNRGLS